MIQLKNKQVHNGKHKNTVNYTKTLLLIIEMTIKRLKQNFMA